MRTAFRLWAATAVLVLLGWSAALVLIDGGSRDPDVAELVLVFRVFAGVLAVVPACLVLLFAARMRAGRGWARFALVALGALVLVLNPGTLLGGRGAVGLGYSALLVALLVGATWMMFRPESTGYFTAARRGA